MGIYPTDIPRCWLGNQPCIYPNDNLLVTDKSLKNSTDMATQKSNNPAIVAMQEMMQRRIEQEPEFALKMANPNKSMEGAINFYE